MTYEIVKYLAESDEVRAFYWRKSQRKTGSMFEAAPMYYKHFMYKLREIKWEWTSTFTLSIEDLQATDWTYEGEKYQDIWPLVS